MRIACVEVANFRKLLSVRIELGPETTLFVGSNNSGKTSAMLALRRFLTEEGKTLRTHDLTLSRWAAVNAIGVQWDAATNAAAPQPPTPDGWSALLPTLDVWLDVPEPEIHHVSAIIPTLDWPGGLLGVRMRLEPADVTALHADFVRTRAENAATKAAAKGSDPDIDRLSLWPRDMIDFLGKRLRQHFVVRQYLLDPEKLKSPVDGQAQPQPLPPDALPLDGAPLRQLIRVDQITAHRSFGSTADDSGVGASAHENDGRRLSDQLRHYYTKYLEASGQPGVADLSALAAIEAAQGAFDKRLTDSFSAAFKEVEGLGYPGRTDPRIRVSTNLRAVDGLNHDAAVSFEIDVAPEDGEATILRVPEGNNGLGYQNLISMVFRLMGFRDAWMRVGVAASARSADTSIEPIHLVLVEEPEAHLHAQVQQVFIKKAYGVLRSHSELQGESPLTTQLVVSTHSSHVAHEVPFASLRYFQRTPAGYKSPIPVSSIINLSEVFGDETSHFVTRYLRAHHADLFFADAAILIEGPAERMLVPHFIRCHHPFLTQCYISVLEIGGSHAHRLKPLIERLGLPTLIITDIDPCGAGSTAAVAPRRATGQRTNNATLRTWVPVLQALDELLDAAPEAKVASNGPLFAVRVAYQKPISFLLSNGSRAEALASTFEDSLVLENVEFFGNMVGTGLIAQFREAIQKDRDRPIELASALFDDLRSGKKAEFALQVIDAAVFEKMCVPSYIDEGLCWLAERLRRKQVEIVVDNDGGVA